MEVWGRGVGGGAGVCLQKEGRGVLGNKMSRCPHQSPKAGEAPSLPPLPPHSWLQLRGKVSEPGAERSPGQTAVPLAGGAGPCPDAPARHTGRAACHAVSASPAHSGGSRTWPCPPPLQGGMAVLPTVPVSPTPGTLALTLLCWTLGHSSFPTHCYALASLS